MKKVLLAVLAATLTLCSCTAPYHKLYVGTDRPRNEVALLNYAGRGFLEPIKDEHNASLLKQVDDVSWQSSSKWDGSYRIELLPGTHTLVICCHRNVPVASHDDFVAQKTVLVYAKPSDITIRFTAQAGHVYTPKAKFIYPPGHWQLWIEDVTGSK